VTGRGTATRSVVAEGAHFGTGRDNVAENAIHVLEHVSSGNPHDAEAFTSQQRIASGVSLRLVAGTVALPVDFDNEPPLQTSKVHRHLTDRKLLSELQPFRSLSKNLPQQDFRQAHLAPQLTCALYVPDWCLEDAWAPSTMLRMVPLPVSGRIIEARPCHASRRAVRITRHATCPRLAMSREAIIRAPSPKKSDWEVPSPANRLSAQQ
jgi:hypothetical protein